jgi:hypothetical protein
MSPPPPLTHIERLSDGRGIFEHADGISPRVAGGYCLDDVARALIVMCRQPRAGNDAARLTAVYFEFLLDAQVHSGACRNRLDPNGRWLDEPDVGDWWGRAMWAFGTAMARSPDSWIQATAATRFDRGAARRSPDLRASAFACLGAAEMLTAKPDHPSARAILADFVDRFGRPTTDRTWPWPEARLAYANAAIPEALIAAGQHLGDAATLGYGLHLLNWLLDGETTDGHLSVTPVGGRGPGDSKPAFDQQPIEVAAIADACVRAFQLTGDAKWADRLDLAVRWFLGLNDHGLPMWDESSGGGFDALTATGRNTNQGAESTLAMVATLQHAHRPQATRR